MKKEEDGRGNMDYWIVKLDKEGKIKWQKTYGGAQLDILQCVEQTKDGGFILGGSSNSRATGDKTENNFGFNDYWIIKTDDKGGYVMATNIGRR